MQSICGESVDTKRCRKGRKMRCGLDAASFPLRLHGQEEPNEGGGNDRLR